MGNKRIRKSTVILWAFTLYSVAVYAYYLPRTDLENVRVWLMLGLNAVVIVVLWWLYRKREKRADEHGRETENRKGRCKQGK